MADPVSTPVAALAFFTVGALAVYGRQIRRIAGDGGKVRGDALGFPELLVSIVLASYFALTPIFAASLPAVKAPDIRIDMVLPSSLNFILMTVGIAFFVRYRGQRLRPAFGLDRVSALAVVGWSCGLVLAAFPLTAAANLLTPLALHRAPEAQPLVDLFIKVAHLHDFGAIGKIVLAAVFIQPVCEEFLFRGFFYGVWKRYLGPVGAGFLACLLFAAVHASLSAFAGLFVLAVCLNIAYERTGSLLVPMVMHALFNLTSLLFIYAQAQPSGAP